MTADQNLPPPLVDAAVNLSALRFMPVDVRHLLASPTWILAAVDDPQIGHALISLWAHSWHQIPAASLPANDKVLARFAMCDSPGAFT